MDDAIKVQITDNLVNILLELCPDFTSVPMYGGTIIELVKGEANTRIGGFFVYKNHVSLEFSEGISLNDPKQFLEGSGKARRHIKLRSLDDIKVKDCQFLLRQAIARI